MRESSRQRLIQGIIVMSNPAMIIGVVAMMLIFGWLRTGQLGSVLWIIAGAYLVLSLIGGQLAKGMDRKS